MHRKSAYLVGRDETVCHLVVRHPSCSKQHAVLQYRQRSTSDRPGSRAVAIKCGPWHAAALCSAAAVSPATPARPTARPYIMDLDSTNGTFLNKERIEAARSVRAPAATGPSRGSPAPPHRYYEVLNGDVIKFGESSREYVAICVDAALSTS